jgi:hypothetical protein
MALRSTQPLTVMSTRNLLVGGRWRVKGCLPVRLTISSPYVSPLFRKCESSNISQSYEPPPPVTWIALYFTLHLTEKDYRMRRNLSVPLFVTFVPAL